MLLRVLLLVISSCVYNYCRCLQRCLFGMSEDTPGAGEITPGSILLLYNSTARQVYGVIEATTPPRHMVEPRAFVAENEPGVTPLPLQVR